MSDPAPTTERPRPKLELADIFRESGEEYCRTHFVTPAQRQVMRAIVQCRTAALGGHLDECDTCGHQRISYNSCRNRHCPKCQGLESARWAEAQLAELLPIEYYHVVFTLPDELNPLARSHPREVYDLLFATATQTLQAFAHRELGGELGITAVLHTWGQALQVHLHLHCIVTGGALTTDGGQFRRCRQGYLFGVLALSQEFRARYVAGLRRWAAAEAAAGASEQAGLERALEQLAEVLSEREFVVYAKRPMSGPRQVVEYLSRYTQRIAISNGRLESVGPGVVRFRWKDYRAGGVVKVMALPVMEFIRRFLQHVLPAGYVRVRHYGLLAPRQRAEKLQQCRELLGVPQREVPSGERSGEERLAELTGRDLRQCEQCGRGRMRRVAEWAWWGNPPVRAVSQERRAA